MREIKTKVKEEKNQPELKFAPKVSLAFNHVMVTMNKKEVSKLILQASSISENRDPFLLDTQVVLAVGPFIKKENGIDLQPGDKVLLDTRKLQAKNALVLTYEIDAATGTLVTMENENDFKDTPKYNVMLITDREVLLKVE